MQGKKIVKKCFEFLERFLLPFDRFFEISLNCYILLKLAIFDSTMTYTNKGTKVIPGMHLHTLQKNCSGDGLFSLLFTWNLYDKLKTAEISWNRQRCRSPNEDHCSKLLLLLFCLSFDVEKDDDIIFWCWLS